MKPVLLLIPGMLNTAQVWRSVVSRMSSDVDVRVADVQTQDSMADMAADAWARVADLPADTPLIVCGFSMGGYVLIELLVAHRERVNGVAFVDSSAGVETPESLVIREKTMAALQRNFDKTVLGTISYSLHPSHQGDAALVEAMRSMMHQVGAQTAIRQTRALVARKDHRAMLAKLHLPTLVVCGREDKVTPPALSQELASLIPGARFVCIEQAGHQTPMEQPQWLAELLLSLVGLANKGR